MKSVSGKYNPKEYSDMVRNLAKPGRIVIEDMSPRQAHLVHMAIGISGESGKLLDTIKKHCIYQKGINIANVIEELGDIEFYMEGMRSALGITRDQCILHNMYKLGKIYKSGKYSNAQAIDRRDETVCGTLENLADDLEKKLEDIPADTLPVNSSDNLLDCLMDHLKELIKEKLKDAER